MTTTDERPLLCVGPCRRPREDGTGGPRQTAHGSALCEICAENFADNLHHIADAWGDLEQRVAASDARGVGDEKVKGSRVSYGIQLNEPVVQLRADVEFWTRYVARVVLENPYVSGPADASIPGLLRWIARWHASAITHHSDTEIAGALAHEARQHERDVTRRAYPKGCRRIDLRSHKCPQIVTDGDQPHICGGHYFAIVNPESPERADLICTENEEHRIPPSQWARKHLLHAIDSIDGTSWLTPVFAAAKLGTTVDNVYNLARREQWERRANGRSVKYLERDINRTLEARATQPATVGAGA